MPKRKMRLLKSDCKIREGISMNLATELSGIEASQVQNNRGAF